MKFDLVDRVLELAPDRIVTLKQVTAAEEYLGDHFPGYPILPGVMMLESMVQAARRLLEVDGGPRLVLGTARNIKYGAMVRPGDALRIEVSIRTDHRTTAEGGNETLSGSVDCKGSGLVIPADSRTGELDGHTPETAVAGRFTMRPLMN